MKIPKYLIEPLAHAGTVILVGNQWWNPPQSISDAWENKPRLWSEQEHRPNQCLVEHPWRPVVLSLLPQNLVDLGALVGMVFLIKLKRVNLPLGDEDPLFTIVHLSLFFVQIILILLNLHIWIDGINFSIIWYNLWMIQPLNGKKHQNYQWGLM